MKALLVISPNMCYVKCFALMPEQCKHAFSFSASYFALLSLGSSPSDDEEGDGEGPD